MHHFDLVKYEVLGRRKIRSFMLWTFSDFFFSFRPVSGGLWEAFGRLLGGFWGLRWPWEARGRLAGNSCTFLLSCTVFSGVTPVSRSVWRGEAHDCT